MMFQFTTSIYSSMGQILSYISGPSPPPPLLRLPTEILLLIASQLSSSPESFVALSLTCKTLSSILDRDTANLGDTSRRDLLVLLERDLGDRFFYCSGCCQLHPFSQQWNPTSTEHPRITKISCFCHHYSRCFKPNLGFSRYQLYVSYHSTCLTSII